MGVSGWQANVTFLGSFFGQGMFDQKFKIM